MARQVGMVFVICALFTGGARSAYADHGARNRRNDAEALRVYVSTYIHSLTRIRLTPTYARQTGLACSACHTHFPELTATGRAFKLNGYVFRRSESLEGKNPEGQQSLLLNLVAPVSLMVQTSYTSTRKAQPGTQNGAVLFPGTLVASSKSRSIPRAASSGSTTRTSASPRMPTSSRSAPPWA